MIKKFSAPRGTSDILPEHIPAWEMVETSARRILKTYGYREIRTPIYEETALFKRSLGPTSDIVNKQLLELATSKDEGYALRPEGTASVVRSYIENDFDKKEPLSKLFYIGSMFRGERPQKGRLRQFHQIGAEAIGPHSTSPYLDAEMIILAMNLLDAFAVKGLQLKINSLGSKEDKAHISAWLRGEFSKHKKDLCPECQERFQRNVFRLLDCKKEQCRKIVSLVVARSEATKQSQQIASALESRPRNDTILLPLSDASRKYFEQVQSCLKNAGINFEITPHLVRGLDYYVHTVFEITAEGLGSQDAVGAGGRYSGLIHELGGHAKTDYGAIGFALGIERILVAAKNETSLAPLRMDAFVIAMDEVYQSQAFALTQRLRQVGISTDMSYSGGSLKSQMNKANKTQARFALILGEEEIKNNAVAVKDMQTSQQETIEIKKVVEILRNKLERL